MFKDFDVIVVYDSSRLTRGGARHGFTVRSEFAREGVLIISVMDPIPDGDFKDMIQSVMDTQNHLQAKKTSGFVTRGILDAVRRKSVEKHGAAPIGVDRQYLDVNGKPKLRLRQLSGGIRELLQEPSGEVIARHHRGEHPTAAYLLGEGETVRLVPGDSHVMKVIREAFRLRYRDGQGFTRIAKYVVEQGVKPLRAQAWTAGAMRDILTNPTYLGWSYFMKLKCGLYHFAGQDRPQEREVNQDELEKLGRESVPRDRRPVEEMIEVQHPELANFIEDAEVRVAAERVIRGYYQDWHLRHAKPKLKNNSNQPNSRFFLKDVLRDKYYNRKFCGQTHGRNSKYRDYMCNPVIEVEPRECALFTTAPAPPLEGAALGVLKEVFANTAEIKSLIDGFVTDAIAALPSEQEKQKLREELEAIKARVLQMQRSFTADELRDSGQVIEELRNRRAQIEHRLAMAQNQVKLDPQKLAADIHGSLCEFQQHLGDGDCYEKLRMLVNVICPRVTVDLETFEAEVMVALPKQILYAADWRTMCGTCGREVSNAGVAHRDFWLPLGNYWLVPVIERPRTRKHRPKISGYEWMRIDEPPSLREAA